MSSEAVSAVLNHSTITDPYGRLVFVTIAHYVGPKGEAGYPSVRTIAEKAACDKNTVSSWVARIEETGELTTRKEGSGRGTRIYYTVNLPFDSDNNKGTYEPSSDNNPSDNNGGMSEKVDGLYETVALMSEQIGLLYEVMSDNVLTIVQTETNRNQLETSRKPERETNARARKPLPPLPPYELPDEARPDYDRLERRGEMVAAIGAEVRDIFAVGVNEEEFYRIADAIIGLGDVPDNVKGFDDWWQSGNSWYDHDGKASIIHFFGAYDDFRRGVKKKSKSSKNGHKVDQQFTVGAIKERLAKKREENANAVA